MQLSSYGSGNQSFYMCFPVIGATSMSETSGNSGSMWPQLGHSSERMKKRCVTRPELRELLSPLTLGSLLSSLRLMTEAHLPILTIQMLRLAQATKMTAIAQPEPKCPVRVTCKRSLSLRPIPTKQHGCCASINANVSLMEPLQHQHQSSGPREHPRGCQQLAACAGPDGYTL